MQITVVIPTHNRRETLLLAVESARRQSRPPEQIIVVCDGCTDGTQSAVADLGDSRIDLLDLPKGKGYGYGHRNEALRRAHGDVVAWLADDDLYLPDHLERIGELFDSGEVDLVQAGSCMVPPDSSLVPFGMDWRVPYYRRFILAGGNRTPASAVSHLVGSALDVGGWDEGVERAGDLDLWQRMIRAGARISMTGPVTVLHFRASLSDQRYRERVEQNREFLARIGDPRALASLRAEITLADQRRLARGEIVRQRLMLGLPWLRRRIRLRTRLRERRLGPK